LYRGFTVHVECLSTGGIDMLAIDCTMLNEESRIIEPELASSGLTVMAVLTGFSAVTFGQFDILLVVYPLNGRIGLYLNLLR